MICGLRYIYCANQIYNQNFIHSANYFYLCLDGLVKLSRRYSTIFITGYIIKMSVKIHL